MRSDDVIAQGGRVLADVMARKMRFILIVLTVGIAGILFAHGFTWTSVMFTLLAVVMIGAAYVAFSFWIWFFRNLGGTSGTSKEPQ